MLIYASPSDLTTGDTPWLEASPNNAGSLLRSASSLVAEATVASFYDTDDTGLPTDDTVLAAFVDATCAQVASWVSLGIDPLALGLDGKAPTKSKSLDGASVDYDTSQLSTTTALAARQAAAGELCDQSQRILRQAGVLSTRVWTYG